MSIAPFRASSPSLLEAAVESLTTAGAGPSPAASTSAAEPLPGALPGSRVEALSSRIEFTAPPAGRDADLEALLGRSAFDPVVSDVDVTQAMARLRTMSPEQFRATVSGLASSGRLATLFTESDASTHAAFLALAADQGLLERLPTRAASAPLFPPAGPTLYRMDAALPQVLNDAVHEHSLDAAARYASDYGAYVTRYAQAVEGCSTAADLRALGAHAPPALLHEWTDRRDPGAARYAREWSRHAVPSEAQALRAVDARLAALTSERASEWVEGKVKASVGGFLGEAVYDGGKPRPGLEAHAGLVGRSGHLVQVEVLDQGAVEGALRTANRDHGIGFAAQQGELTAASLKLGGYGVGLASHRATFEAPIMPGLSATAWADPDTGGFGAGLSLHAEAAGFGELNVRAGGCATGLSRGDARLVAAHRPGAFDRPQELDLGLGWSALSADARAHYEAQGWTEAEWRDGRTKSASTSASP